jgi:hypothetical protein
VADCQYHNLFFVVVIQGDISAMSEVNHSLAELRRQLFDWTANFRVLAEHFYTLPNRLDGTPGCVAALGS